MEHLGCVSKHAKKERITYLKLISVLILSRFPPYQTEHWRHQSRILPQT